MQYLPVASRIPEDGKSKNIMALAVDGTCLHNVSPHLFALVLMHVVLWARFRAQISASFLYSSSTPVRALSQFLFHIFLLPLFNIAWYQVIK
jgi:hypothetical protein